MIENENGGDASRNHVRTMYYRSSTREITKQPDVSLSTYVDMLHDNAQGTSRCSGDQVENSDKIRRKRQESVEIETARACRLHATATSIEARHAKPLFDTFSCIE